MNQPVEARVIEDRAIISASILIRERRLSLPFVGHQSCRHSTANHHDTTMTCLDALLPDVTTRIRSPSISLLRLLNTSASTRGVT